MPDEKDDTPEIDIEFHTTSEYIAGAYNCLQALECVDAMTKNMEGRKKKLQRMCFEILEFCIKEYHDELIDPTKQDNDE